MDLTCSTCIYSEIIPYTDTDEFGAPEPIQMVCICYFSPEPITRRADKFCSEHITEEEFIGIEGMEEI